MASKYQMITGMYESTIEKVTKTQNDWNSFLRSACRNYKCRFDEQILIYAQRPDATAVLEVHKWNDQFGRWVNKGAKGIAVFNDEHNGNYRLKHYFDITDTHQSRFARPVPIWQMESEYESEIIESLENSFGDLNDKSTLAEALISAANNAVEDNMADYLSDLMNIRDNSLLEELDELNVEVEYRRALQYSVAYMLLSRCGINADEYIEPEDFQYILSFNTSDTVNALGMATSDIAEMCLRDIALTINSIKRENRTFAISENTTHNIENEQNNERGAINERSDNISERGRLSAPESDITTRQSARRGAGSSPWQIRITPQEISQAEPQNPVHQPLDERIVERTPIGNRADSEPEDGAVDITDGTGTERDGAAQSQSADEMGWDDEQYSEFSGGDDTERPDILIKPIPTLQEQMNLLGEAEEIEPSAFSMPEWTQNVIPQQIIDEVLTSGGNNENSILRIAAYFKKDKPVEENSIFLCEEYGVGGKGFIINENKVSTWFDNAGIHIAYGNTVRDENTTLITWEGTCYR